MNETRTILIKIKADETVLEKLYTKFLSLLSISLEEPTELERYEITELKSTSNGASAVAERLLKE